MKPDWSSDGVDLYCADCRDVLPHIQSVDAVVTDPPFGIGFKYESHDDTLVGYGKWLWGIISKAESLCTPGSPIFVWQGMQNCRYFSEWFPRNYRIFAACKNFVQITSIVMQFSFDPVIVWWVEYGKWYNRYVSISRDYHIANTASFVTNTSALERQHPCPRPIDSVKYIVQRWVRTKSICLDPFMGGGTTGVACMLLGRKFIGIEKETKYFDICIKRIEKAIEDRKVLVEKSAEFDKEFFA